MLLGLSLGWVVQLHGNKLVPPSLEAGDDGSDEAPLHSVWLECDERALLCGAWDAPPARARSGREDENTVGKSGCM